MSASSLSRTRRKRRSRLRNGMMFSPSSDSVITVITLNPSQVLVSQHRAINLGTSRRILAPLARNDFGGNS